MRRTLRLTALLAVLTLVYGFITPAQSAWAQVVTNTNDSGMGSLREAITTANGGGGTITFDIDGDPNCSSGVCTIMLTSAVSPAFGKSALEISNTITIEGDSDPDGDAIVIDAGSTMRHFYIGGSGDLTLEFLTLQNGMAEGFDGGESRRGGTGGGSAGMGGAIFNDGGTLTVNNSTLTGNTAQGGDGAAIEAPDGNPRGGGGGAGSNGNGGNATPIDTPGAGGSGGGGAGGAGDTCGVGDPGTALGAAGGGGGGTANNPACAGGAGAFGGGGGGGGGGSTGQAAGGSGTGGFGGGIGGAGTSGGGVNQPGGSGGGGGGLGGAIFNNDGTVTIVNSTISGNTAAGGSGGDTTEGGNPGGSGSGFGGGIFNYNGTLTTQNVTVNNNTANDGGGIYNLGDGATATATIDNTIVANSSAGDDFLGNAVNGGTNTTSGTGNLMEHHSFFVGTVVTTADPELIPLGNYGGLTETHGLCKGAGDPIGGCAGTSPAMEAGDGTKVPGGQLYDQRGTMPFDRVADGDQNGSTLVDIGAFEVQGCNPLVVTNTSDADCGSLRFAITTANAMGGTDDITFEIPGGGPHVITPATALPTITEAVTIDGSTQTGNAGVCTNPIPSRPAYAVVLDGGGGAFSGLTLAAGSAGSTIRGLNIRDFAASGIVINGSGSNTVACNFIGTDEDGDADNGNGLYGVRVTGNAPSNTLGTDGDGANDANEGNLISGNTGRGVVIDGAGSSGNTVAGNFIGTDVTGTAAVANGIGVHIDQAATGNLIGGSTVEARNVISGNTGWGVVIGGAGSSGNTVAGNFIGTDGDGMVAVPNAGGGVGIFGAASNLIGTNGDGASDTAERNVISGNGLDGVFVDGAAGNTIAGNYIGPDVTGAAALANARHGVVLSVAISNLVGTDSDGTADIEEGNLISGNTTHGVQIIGDGATVNTIAGNLIGLNTLADAALPNGGNGVDISGNATGNFIGGAAGGNFISGNTGRGVAISGVGSSGNTIAGNTIGLNGTGAAALANGGGGVGIFGAPSNRIGTDGDGTNDFLEANFISGNGLDGIFVDGAAFNSIKGNRIGTDWSGTVAVGNARHGVVLSAAPSNRVGTDLDGTSDIEESNLISGNVADGVQIIGTAATDNIVWGNLIGTDATGAAPLGNGGNGVSILGDASDNAIGGVGGVPNIIAFNGEDGVVVDGANATGNSIILNSIFENTQLGIDLGDDGPTDNDAADADASPNKLQNTPEITFVEVGVGGDLLVTYLVDSDPANQTYPLRVEFFLADVDEEEGQNFVGFNTYTAANFAGGEKTVNLGPIVGTAMVTTATDADGNTSEFSVPEPLISAQKTFTLADGPPPAVPDETITYTVEIANNGTASGMMVELVDPLDPNTTLIAGSGTIAGATGAAFDYTGGTFTATLDAPLPALGAGVTITFQATIHNPVPAGTDYITNQGTVSGDNFDDVLTDDPNNPMSDADPTQIELMAMPIVITAKMDAVVINNVGDPGADPGDVIEYSVDIENIGDEGVDNVVLTDTVDPNTTLSCGSITTTKGSVSSCAGNTFAVSMGMIDGLGGVVNLVTVTFQVTINDPFPSDVFEVANQGVVSGTDIADVPTDDPDTAVVGDETITPMNTSDVTVIKTLISFEGHRNGPGPEDDTFTANFTLTALNNGPNTATGVTVSDPVPDGVMLDAVDPAGAYNAGTGIWTVGTLSVGASATLSLVFTADSENNLFNYATISATQPEPRPDNNDTGSLAQHDNPDVNRFQADLSLTKTVDNATPSPGSLVTYTIIVTNEGPSATSGVRVQDLLPAGVEFVSATTSNAASCPACGYDDALGVWIVGHVPNNATATLEITARVTGTGEITNTAEVLSSNLPDPDSRFGNGDASEDDQASATIDVSSAQPSAQSEAGASPSSDTKAEATAADEAGGVPKAFVLEANYPNPFNPQTTIPYAVPEASQVRIAVYDVLGREVATLVDDQVSAGRYEAVWEAGDLPSGLYLVRLVAAGVVQTRRVTLIK